ncbi:MAG TPA: beta-ketoacyl-ACP synthase III [Armatimonadaceae bacterium]|nr:beta-ketoacyl-ACP synthase III [Armatimonadaceae bacterium]
MALELRSARVAGIGMYAPERILTNQDLEVLVETTDDWIVSRTGIRERRIAAADEATSDLALPAAREALRTAGVDPADLDLIVLATCTGDMGTFPATATIVQAELGARRAAAFDVAAVCSGFTFALDIGAQFIETGRANNVLVIGAETLSKVVDWTDRNTCVLFGDGAGAAVLQPCPPGEGLLGSVLGTDGSGACLLNIPGGGSRLPLTPDAISEGQGFIKMKGREVFRFAVEIMGEAAVQALTKVGLTPADVDLFVPHQANVRIIDAAMQRLKLPPEKVYVNVDRYGNTSAASVPMALYEAWKQGKVRPGDIVVTVGFGAGLTWGANVIKWGDLLP